MKKIYFIRHAKSSWKDLSLDDYDRPLNSRGKNNAPMMGQRFKNRGIIPDIMISSGAKRAKKTAIKIAYEVGYSKDEIIYDDRLYESNFVNYLEVIKNIDKKYKNIFIFAHNPDITEVVNTLGNGEIDNIPTCGVVCIKFETKDFKNIENSKSKILFFDYPKNL